VSGRVLGITGSIGAGKSTVGKALRDRGWPVLDVDDAASESLPDALPELALVVPTAVSSDGLVDKGVLFAAMMSDAALRSRVEACLRPHVVRRIKAWIAALNGPGALEAALLFELGLDQFCDMTLCLQCAREERRRRVEARPSTSARHFEAMDAAQLPESEKMRRADAVVSTDGPLEETAARLDAALKRLGFQRRAAADLVDVPAVVTALKLPKDVVADPRHDQLVNLLATSATVLWEGGRHQVATLPMTEALSAALRGALVAGHACQGLELITEKLANEQKGLDAASKKTPESPQNARVSRILFLANDGSTRFYRDCDALLVRYSQRLMACKLDLTGEELGNAIHGSAKLIRSVLVHDKKFGAQALLALLPRG
jgi:dephospho-CoA kinase